jgi:hypothetical protein
MGAWGDGMLGLEDWENGVLTNNCMKCYYSINNHFRIKGGIK